MKEITCQEITETLKTMCIEAATDLPKDCLLYTSVNISFCKVKKDDKID